MALDKQPLTALQNQQSALQARNTQLTSLQTALQTVALNAQALGSPGLFANSQSVTSSNSVPGERDDLVGRRRRRLPGRGHAARQLGPADVRVHEPSSDQTFTVDGGSSITSRPAPALTDLANTINADPNQTVYAAAIDSGTIVFSDRATGAPDTGAYITLGGSPTALTEQTVWPRAGQDAKYSIDGGWQRTSSSNTVTGAIAGVTLTSAA